MTTYNEADQEAAAYNERRARAQIADLRRALGEMAAQVKVLRDFIDVQGDVLDDVLQRLEKLEEKGLLSPSARERRRNASRPRSRQSRPAPITT